MVKFKIFIAIIFVSSNCVGQEIIFDWKKLLGDSSGNNNGLCIEADSSGFIYVGGSFGKKIELPDTMYYTSTYENGVLLKMDTSGTIVWSKHFYSKWSSVTSIALDKNENILVVGYYTNDLLFDTVLQSNNSDSIYSSNMFIAKYTPNGVLIWAKSTGGVNFLNRIFIDNNNDILLVGRSIDVGYFDTSVVVTTLDSIWNSFYSKWDYFHPTVGFVAKYDENGNKKWIKSISGNSTLLCRNIICDMQNNIYITGDYYGTIYIDTFNITPVGYRSIFLSKFTSNGQVNWIETSGGSAENSGMAVAIDTANNVYLSGYLQGSSVTFSDSVIASNAIGSFIAKYNSYGSFLWLKQNYDGVGTTLILDNEIDILLAGSGVKKLDLNGNILKEAQLSYSSYINDIAVDKANNIYIVGNNGFTIGTNTSRFILIGKFLSELPSEPVSLPTAEYFTIPYIIYPNPSTGFITFDFSNSVGTNKILAVKSLSGEIIKKTIIADNVTTLEINIDKLRAGVYIVEIQESGSVFQKKVIKL